MSLILMVVVVAFIYQSLGGCRVEDLGALIFLIVLIVGTLSIFVWW